MRHLRGLDGLRFGWAFLKARRRAAGLDLSAFRARGLKNEAFLAQQVEYLTVFAALAEVLGGEVAVATMKEVMDETAQEALLLCLPEVEEMKRFADPLAAWRDYARASPPAARAAGSQEMVVVEDSEHAFQFDVTWCIWLELAGGASCCDFRFERIR
jgi:hypothetical protein